MKLSEKDIRMVKKLRKRQQQFQRWRLPMLILHGLLIIALFVELILVINFPSDNITSRLIIATYSFPPIFLFMALSSFWFSYTLWNWRGEPKTELLLKVIDELQKGDA